MFDTFISMAVVVTLVAAFKVLDKRDEGRFAEMLKEYQETEDSYYGF